MSTLSSAVPKQILGVVVLFLLVGEIVLFSATGVLGLERHGDEFYYVTRQSLCAILGLLAMLIVGRIRYQTWEKLAYGLFFTQVILSGATLFTHYGHTAMGATRWLKFGPLTFQPSELSKITVAIFLAKVLSRGNRDKPIYRFAHLAGFLLLLLVIYRQTDLGSTVLLSAMALGLLFISGVRQVYLLLLLASSSAFFVYSMMHSEYRRRRVMTFLNPWLDPQGNGFQTIQSFLSFYSGKFFGVGIGNGNSKLFFLPEVHTDFIFSLIGEELGFLGALTVILLFVYLGFLLFKVASKAPDDFGCFLGFGLAFSLILQVIVNLGGVTGLIPIKGLTLPFISWGRSGLLMNLFSVGILLNIARQSGIISSGKERESV